VTARIAGILFLSIFAGQYRTIDAFFRFLLRLFSSDHMYEAKQEHAFSVELKSPASIRRVYLSFSGRNQVLFEGALGELSDVRMIEDAILEISGSNGTLRLDMSPRELERVLTTRKKES